MSVSSKSQHITVQNLLSKKQQDEKIVSVTAYDYSSAKVIDQLSVVDFLLVGDSLGMVLLGYPDTLSVTMDEMLHHVKAVSRGASRAMIVADMPFMSVHVDKATGVANAARMIQEGRANAVKIEGASELTLNITRHLSEIGIPVMGHLGFTPQSVQAFGGFKVQGKTMAAVETLLKDALALQEVGAFALVVEMIPHEVADLLTQVLNIPIIGIGAGPGCDGQILVLDDLIGKFPDFRPKFVRPYGDFNALLTQAITQYAADIQSEAFPNRQSEAFAFPVEWLADLETLKTQTRCTSSKA